MSAKKDISSKEEGFSTSLLSILSALDCIERSDVNLLTKILKTIPLNRLSVYETDDLLNSLLTKCQDSKNTECIKPIFDAWQEIYPDIEEEDISLFSTLFISPMFKAETLRFVLRAMPHQAFSFVMNDLIDMDENDNILMGCQKVVQVFGPQPRNKYENIRDKAESTGNYTISEYMNTLLEETNAYAKIPPWVKNFLNPNDRKKGEPIPDYIKPQFRNTSGLPKESEIQIPQYVKPKFKTLSVDESVDMLIIGYKASGANITDENETDIRDTIRAELLVATHTQKQILFDPELTKLDEFEARNRVDLFRLLGPVNTQLDSDAENAKYGGSRMFLDPDFNPDLEKYEEWFHGVCEECHLKILRRWHAIRMPLATGQWTGCYCSIRCLFHSLEDNEIKDHRANIAARFMIESVEEQLMSIGIQDRLPN